MLVKYQLRIRLDPYRWYKVRAFQYPRPPLMRSTLNSERRGGRSWRSARYPSVSDLTCHYSSNRFNNIELPWWRRRMKLGGRDEHISDSWRENGALRWTIGRASPDNIWAISVPTRNHRKTRPSFNLQHALHNAQDQAPTAREGGAREGRLHYTKERPALSL